MVDAARGKLWSELSKAIIVAAKSGGGDPDANFRLRKAIEDAKAVSMRKDNITRAIKRGTGELDGGDLEEIIYEGTSLYVLGFARPLREERTSLRDRTLAKLRQLKLTFDMLMLHGASDVLEEMIAVCEQMGDRRNFDKAAALDALMDATVVLPLDFTRLIWTSLIGYFAFAEWPDVWTWIGGTTIFVSATYIAYRESKTKRALPPADGAIVDKGQPVA